MTIAKMLEDKRIGGGLAVFASLYAKRMMEGQYDRLLTTSAGKQLHALSGPTKLGIEAALNLLAALASTQESALTDKAWKKFAYEVLLDAPPEIAKRLLNGPKAEELQSSVRPDTPISSEQQAAWETFRQLEPQTMESLLGWLRSADASDRQQLADYLVKLVEDQRTERPAVARQDPEGNVRAAPSPAPTSTPTKKPGILWDLARSMANMNEALERRSAKKSDVVKGGC